MTLFRKLRFLLHYLHSGLFSAICLQSTQEISAFHFFFFLPTIGPRMRNEQGTLWGLCCFPMLEIQGDLYTFGGESESHNDPDKKRTIFKLTCDNRKCKWSQFFSWSYRDERSHLVAIPVPDSFCT